MHQAYQPILPSGSKYLQLKWDKAKYEEHKKRIQAAKPSVDTSVPAARSHLRLKFGKLKLEEDQLSVIRRGNPLLQEKVFCTTRTKGQIDNKNCYKANSLNREKRKQEQQRATQGNPAILGRVTKPEPRCRARRWHEDWQRAEKHTSNVARHPCGQCKSQSQKKEPFKKKTPKQDRKGEQQLKEEGVKSKMREKERHHVHHGKGKDQ